MSTKPGMKPIFLKLMEGEAQGGKKDINLTPSIINTWGGLIPEKMKEPEPPSKMDFLLIKDGPYLSAAYVDEDGYPRMFEPAIGYDDDEYICYNPNDGIRLVPIELVHILEDGESPKDVQNGMVCFDKPEIMKTGIRKEHVQTLIKMINGEMH